LSKQRNNRGSGDHGSKDGQNPTQSPKCFYKPPPGIQTVRIEPSTKDYQRDTEQETYQSNQIRLARWLNWITAIAAGCSLCALGFLYQSTTAATSQAKTAQQEFKASQRPWVSLSVTAEILFIRGDNVWLQPTSITMVNYGHSVAKNVRYRPWLIAEERETSKECETSTDVRAGEGQILFPSEVGKGTFDAIDYSGLQAELKKTSTRGSISFRLIGCVLYSSTIDDLPHYTRVSYWVRAKDVIGGPGEYHISLEPDFNGADAN
jgi:hypothetical protein